MKIEWNKVTWYSKLAAVILALAIFTLGFYFGKEFEKVKNIKLNVNGRLVHR